jgi:hypothetical protein
MCTATGVDGSDVARYIFELFASGKLLSKFNQRCQITNKLSSQFCELFVLIYIIIFNEESFVTYDVIFTKVLQNMNFL